MIHKKMETLSEDDHRLLQYASVEGEEFSSTLLSALLAMPEIDLEERLARLERLHEFVRVKGEEELPDGELSTRYRFSHALYQNVLYGELVPKRKIALHREVAVQLLHHWGADATRIAAQLAMHFLRGRDFARAVEHLIKAGDQAAAIYANGEAETHYTNAFHAVAKLPVEQQTNLLVTVLAKRGQVNFALSRFEAAAQDFRDMQRHARAIESAELECRALIALATALFWWHRMDEMPARAEEAVEAARRSGQETLRVDALQLIALKELCYGELSKAEASFDEIIASSRRLQYRAGLLQSLTWRGSCHFFRSQYAAAESMLLEAYALASELRESFSLMVCLFFLGLSRGNTGRMSEALETLDTAMKMAARNGDQFWFPRLPNCIGWIHRELGDIPGALRHDEQGVEVARERHVLEAEANSLINIGIDLTHLHRPDEHIEQAFHKVEDIFHRDAWFRWRYNTRHQCARSEHWLAQGDLQKAADYAHRLLEMATEYGCAKYMAVAHYLLAKIAMREGANDNTERELLTALAILQESPVRVTEWKVLAALGQVRHEKGNSAGAEDAFRRAAAIVGEISNNVHDETLRNTFLSSSEVQFVIQRAA